MAPVTVSRFVPLMVTPLELDPVFSLKDNEAIEVTDCPAPISTLSVTVSPLSITTALPVAGTTPPTHVDVALQLPLLALVMVVVACTGVYTARLKPATSTKANKRVQIFLFTL